ncbi:MAG TPA: addiction module protein [Xanthobacteraceae bacterium]|jgi:putative addiction module component (TIGR02574 family)|nr:addiction module protein [Xanthobacteraceae bacterium]
MVKPVAAIQQEIRALTNAEKEELLATLLEELDGPAEAGTEAAWDEEIARRSREIDSGAVQCVPAEDVFSRIDKILGK